LQRNKKTPSSRNLAIEKENYPGVMLCIHGCIVDKKQTPKNLREIID
jgi:hypothetical protein